jgi:hypothetical protein
MNFRVKPLEFDAGILGSEAPVDRGGGRIAGRLLSRYLTDECRLGKHSGGRLKRVRTSRSEKPGKAGFLHSAPPYGEWSAQISQKSLLQSV